MHTTLIPFLQDDYELITPQLVISPEITNSEIQFRRQ